MVVWSHGGGEPQRRDAPCGSSSPHPRLCALPLPPLWWTMWGDRMGLGPRWGEAWEMEWGSQATSQPCERRLWQREAPRLNKVGAACDSGELCPSRAVLSCRGSGPHTSLVRQQFLG